MFKNGEFGNFRYVGLAVILSTSLRSGETTSKAFRKIFDEWGFKITVEAGLKQMFPRH